VITDDRGNPWFVAADVCGALDIRNTSDAVARLDEDEKRVTTLGTNEGLQTQGFGPQSFNVINESGLYSLILTSCKEEAKRFKRWVTQEVLPSIRKTGSYSLAGAAPESGSAWQVYFRRVMHPPLLAVWSPSSQATIQVVGVQPSGIEEDNAKKLDLLRSRSGHAHFRTS